MLAGLSSLVIEGVADQNGMIVIQARTAGGPVACPRFGTRTSQVRGYCGRSAADLPVDGRPVVVRVRVRRMWHDTHPQLRDNEQVTITFQDGNGELQLARR